MDSPIRHTAVRPLLPPRVAEGRAELDEALLHLAERLLSATRPEDAAAVLVEAVVAGYGFPRAVVLGNVSGLLGCLAAHGTLAPSAGLGRSDVVVLAHEQEVTQVVSGLDLAAEPWLTRMLPAGSDVIVVPLRVAQQSLGAVLVQIPMTLRGQQGRRLLLEVERSARYAALAIQREQRLAQLQRLAATDDLTMIANRRSFTSALDREIARSLRHGEPMSLVLLDLDHFKQINDVYGHPAGDEALRNVAAALTVASRTLDTPARYGGEEFAVILPDCDAAQSLVIADRLRAAVSQAPAPTTLTASAGVATFPLQAGNAEELIIAADDALLEAKRSGRDRTVVSVARTTSPRTGAPGPGLPPEGADAS